MKTRRRSCSAVLFSIVVVTMMLSAGVASAQESERTTTQAPMRGLFVVLSNVYKYSLDEKAFADPRNHGEILGLLQALAQNSDNLEAHGGGLDPSFDFMRRSLGRDAHDALESFKSANYVGSRFVLGEITQNCVTCHTKLPAQSTFDSGKEFLEAIDAKDLPPAARARLQVASRQFSDAMTTYEELMLSPVVTAEDLATYDAFQNYLRISIGAMNDTKRPVSTLRQFIVRPDIPEDVKEDARAWIGSLETLNLGAAKGEELAAARRMVAGAGEKTTSLADQSRLVDFIASITLLHHYLRSKPQNDVSVAEAYYLLGVAESHVSRSYWVSETDYLVERSIRLAPKSAVAKQALAFLEDYRANSAAPARALPQGQTSIEELRKLTEQ